MNQPASPAMTTRRVLLATSLLSFCLQPLAAQVVATDDGSPGSPLLTIDGDSVGGAGNSITANDLGPLELIETTVVSEDGVAVSISPAGDFTYDASTNGDAQVLAAGGSLEDSFGYSIFAPPVLAVAPLEALDADSNTNSFGWSGLPAIVPATGEALPYSIDTAYDFTGAAATRPAFDGSSGTTKYDFDDFAIEFWLKRDNTTTNQLLFETGGSAVGSGITLNDDGTVSFYHSPATNSSNEYRTTGALTQGRWHQVVVSLDIDASGANDRLRIYIDGALDVDDSSLSNLDDWSGGNAAGLGFENGDAGGDTTGTGPLNNYPGFDGQLGLMNFHSTVGGTILTDADVLANYNAIANPSTDSATVTLEITGLNDSPGAADDHYLTGPTEDDASFSGTLDLTANDGIFARETTPLPPGSNLSLANFPTTTVSQSPTSPAPPGGGLATRGIDGDPSTYTHTDTDTTVDHTWQIDFGIDVDIEFVDLANRSDCCALRLRDITITIEDAGGTVLASSGVLNPGNALGFDAGAGNPGLSYDFAANNGGNPVTGRRVVVTRTPDLTDPSTADGSILSLGEVSVIGSASVPAVVDSLLLHHDARSTAGGSRWENRGTLGGFLGDWVLGSGVTLNSGVTSARAQISAAYEWDGTVDATAVFASGAFENVAGNSIDQRSATLEIWAKLDAADLTQASTLFETGGGTGLGIVVDNGVLQFATGNQVGLVGYDLVADPAGVMGGLSPTEEFFQVAVALDQARDLGLLYVNGQLVGTATNATTDWSGSDAAGLGRFASTNHGGFASPGAATAYDTYFNGSIASFRLWGAAIGEGRVRQNFEAVANGTDVDGDSLTLTGLVDATGANVGLNTPATLPSGAIVTITDATGSFTYEPNGAFDSLGFGETAIDSFFYEITDGNGAIGRAAVHVPVSGRVDAADDAVAATELITTTIPANFLVGNDQRLAGTTGAYFRIDPANTSGSTIPNAGTGGSTYDLALTGGLVISPPTLRTNFGAIHSALQNGAGNFSSLDPISTDDATFEIWFQP